MSESINGQRLPPPAFPPGARRHAYRTRTKDTEPGSSEGSKASPFISPDEPLPERVDVVGGALISPDEPLPERGTLPLEDGEAVGMDLDSTVERMEIVSGGDPHVLEVMKAVDGLAEALRARGEAGLLTHAEMSRFEWTLRSYCSGYIAGRRAEAPPRLIQDDALPTDA
jgi:hypothetical protein